MRIHRYLTQVGHFGLLLGETLGVMLAAGFVAGCTNPIIMPKLVRLCASEYNKVEYPFMLKIEAYQHIRFNIHTYEFCDEKFKQMFYIFLKKDLGELREGEFFVASLGSFAPMPSKGKIEIRKERILIDVQVAQLGVHLVPIATSWRKSAVNGEYMLVRE
jgi:hypothetical protein